MAKIDGFVNELLLQCAFAIGHGAQMPIQRNALAALSAHVRAGFLDALSGVDPNDLTKLEAEWKKSADFILNCCVRIGQVAATNANTATPAAHFAITDADLRSAYGSVRAPFAAGLPGEYCPA
jgi:hypothetical protein